jgi:NAD(P)-dependent dehydrogenase (short-subunit alcohol dehydrogenase family)
MDKVALITGGSKGIGKAVAIRFAELGYNVAICSKTKDELDAVLSEINKNGNAVAFFCDVRCPDHVKKLFQSVIKVYGRIDALINCAGILGPHGHLENNDLAAWKDTIDVNLLGTVNCVHEAIPIMREQNFGRIVTFCGGGVGGDKLEPGYSAYATSKFAVGGFTEAMSKELCFFDITINAVSPGAIDTDMARQRWVKGDAPDKIVDLIAFLASSDKNINGRILSAKWDDYHNADYSKPSLFMLRRVTSQ